MRFSKKAKKQNGSSLAILVVLLTVMMVFGVGMIAVSNNNALQTKTSVKADQQYYAAEAAAQLGAQMLMRELKAEDLYVAGDKNTSMVDIENAFYSKLEARLKTLYDFLEPEVTDESDSPKFNGQPTTLKRFDMKDLEKYVTKKGEGEDDKEEWKDGNKIIYLDNPIFLVSVESYDFAYDADGQIKLDKDGNPLKSGSRSVIAEVPVNTKLIPPLPHDSDGSTGGSLRYGHGAAYPNRNDGMYAYSENNQEKYDYYIGQLETIASKAKNDFDAHITKSIKDLYNPSDWPNQSAFNANNALNAKHINTWSTVTLGEAGKTTVYPNLLYIQTDNSINILGTVVCPSLIGVKSIGATITGTFYCPSLETFSTSDGNLTISAGSKINPMEYEKPTGPCKFYARQSTYVNCDAEINWCRFYVGSDMEIRYGNKKKFISNSIFYLQRRLQVSGTASSDTSGVIPQFYFINDSGYINFTGDNPGNVTGIIMTPQTSYIFNNGSPLPLDTIFTGLFVGNCDGRYGKSNSVTSPPFSVNDFGDYEYSIIMDGDWLLDGGGPDDPDDPDDPGEPAKVEREKPNKGVTIREGKK